jgi:hypothetical protein
MKKSNLAPALAAVAVLGAAGWALVRRDEPVPEPTPAESVPTPAEPREFEPPAASVLPPNHPPVDGVGSPHGAAGMGAGGPSAGGGDDDPAIAWTVPAGWQTAANPSAMRLATYHPSPSVDVSVSRAGGASDANIQRWVHQFDGSSAPKRTDTTVKGLDVHEVEVSGAYLGGGMMTGTASESHPGWTLVGAIVETRGPHYFFKMIGPAADVTAAKKAFEAMLQGITPH